MLSPATSTRRSSTPPESDRRGGQRASTSGGPIAAGVFGLLRPIFSPAGRWVRWGRRPRTHS